MTSARVVRILVLGNAAAGAEKQALALAARLQQRLRAQHPAVAVALTHAQGDSDDKGVQCVRVPLRSGSIAHRLPPLLHVAMARLRGDTFFGYDLAEPHKELLRPHSQQFCNVERAPLHVVIGCGRTTVALCAMLKLMARDRDGVFNIQIQHPRVPLAWFNAVVAPRHDFPMGSTNKLPQQLHLTTGTVYAADALEAQTRAWEDEELAIQRCLRYSDRRVAWLIGGPCRGFAFTRDDAQHMVDAFVDALRDQHASVFVTFSRRTPAQVVELIERRLRHNFPEPERLFIWDGTGPNPYDTMRANATAIVTTPDSISMTTEAIAAKKAVLTISADRAQGKFHRFHRALFQAKLTAPFTRDTVVASLNGENSQRHKQKQWTPADALEQELAAITDAIATQIMKETAPTP
uniref:Mitochondrial fission ELM1-like protein n=1 Tax=Globisporangium ultimum (strain ATCC 200006 / CBS 805.95 / DAOM BR144) TaxID=431595 RepID=K3X8Y3_GLOUD